MSNISNPLQLHADHPFDPSNYAILLELDSILKRLQCPYMLVGATARDILLHNVFGKPILRATKDVDIAILIDSWERFDAVKTEILRAPGFSPSTAQPYRLLYKTAADEYVTPIDILPFGEIATDAEVFRWRSPDTDLVMNVAAFSDAYESAITVAVGPELTIKIASIPGLLLLKILAWIDRRERRDAQDTLRLLETYGETVGEERLYSEELDLLEASNFDLVMAGARLLAKDAISLATSTTTATICALLNEPSQMDLFRTHLTRQNVRLDESNTNQSEVLLEALVIEFLPSGQTKLPS